MRWNLGIVMTIIIFISVRDLEEKFRNSWIHKLLKKK